MKKILYEFYENDVVLLLNCISLTKDILKLGRKELFDNYFKKELFNTYIYDLTIMQKIIGYRANKVFYNYTNYDMFIGQCDYLNIGNKDFNYLFGKLRKKRLKEISKEISIRKNFSNSTLNHIETNNKIIFKK